VIDEFKRSFWLYDLADCEPELFIEPFDCFRNRARTFSH